MSASAKGKKEEPGRPPRRRIKKVVGHGGHHGGSWKVAYADFVTAMMALFLVLWLLSQADTKLKESVASYFRSSGVFSSQSGGILKGPKKVSQNPSADAASEQNMFAEIAGRLKTQLSSRSEFKGDKDRVKIAVTKDGLQIQIIDKADRVTFESGRADLNPVARDVLMEIAKEVCKLPNPIAIAGHTDKHLFPAGSTYGNWELSADRANAARRALENGCVKPEQIQRVIGYSDTELLYPNQPFAAANRRITITVANLQTSSQTTENKLSESLSDKLASPTPAEEKAATKGKHTEKVEAPPETGEHTDKSAVPKIGHQAKEAAAAPTKPAAH